MSRMMFINLPTRDLTAADTFYGALGFEKNPMFSNEQASCWKASDTIFVMVLAEEFYTSFLRDGDEPGRRSSAISSLHALMLDSKAEVRQLLDGAVEGGGSIYRDLTEPFPGMVDSAVKDPDGHVWEFGWMDPAMAAPGDTAPGANDSVG